MTKTQALERVAALLAFNTLEHKQAAKKDNNLQQNTTEAIQRNRETASHLGIVDAYNANCSLLNV